MSIEFRIQLNTSMFVSSAFSLPFLESQLQLGYLDRPYSLYTAILGEGNYFNHVSV